MLFRRCTDLDYNACTVLKFPAKVLQNGKTAPICLSAIFSQTRTVQAFQSNTVFQIPQDISQTACRILLGSILCSFGEVTWITSYGILGPFLAETCQISRSNPALHCLTDGRSSDELSGGREAVHSSMSDFLSDINSPPLRFPLPSMLARSKLDN